MSDFLTHYHHTLKTLGYRADPGQLKAVEALSAVVDALAQKRWPWQRRQVPRGVYLHGEVGRGKTFVVDLFCHFLNRSDCQRFHFHRFMDRVHHEMTALKSQPDPLVAVADVMAKDLRLLCLDELYVSDIADAMILERLLRALHARGVTWVFTSNLAPSDLYRGGLHRDRFLPAIALIESMSDVVCLDGEQDYRLRTLVQAEVYFVAAADVESRLAQLMTALAPETPVVNEVITVLDRPLTTRQCGDDVVWFEFATLCRTARSQLDYIELARRYHTVLLSDVEQMSDSDNDAARRFIALVDEFYDRGVKLVIAAGVPASNLYTGERLAFPFARCLSRLTEMQSTAYLARPHTP